MGRPQLKILASAIEALSESVRAIDDTARRKSCQHVHHHGVATKWGSAVGMAPFVMILSGENGLIPRGDAKKLVSSPVEAQAVRARPPGDQRRSYRIEVSPCPIGHSGADS